ncbi:hypothetical protein AMECASPLE_036677 [Ameca splendens]|uniref:Uncharacterized protein n=1 Tax=Ameca splendens TaxID=208324 RepID=A0ABV1A3G2_9TELE
MQAYRVKTYSTQSNTSIGSECFTTIIKEKKEYNVHESKTLANGKSMSWLSGIDISQRTQNTDDSKITLPLLKAFFLFQDDNSGHIKYILFSLGTQKQQRLE